MTYARSDHTCGHPMVIDNIGDDPRCAVCQPSPTWHWETRRTHPHHLKGVA